MNERNLPAIAVVLAAVFGALPAGAADAPAKPDATAQSRTVAQAAYASPELAAKALYDAVKSQDVQSIYRVLGPGSDKLIYTGDDVANRQMRERFVAAYDTMLKFERDGDAKASLIVGAQEFPFPFPLVKSAKGWTFDAEAGAEEILSRLIGENELFAIKSCLAYGDSQQEYAEVDRDGDGLITRGRPPTGSPRRGPRRAPSPSPGRRPVSRPRTARLGAAPPPAPAGGA